MLQFDHVKSKIEWVKAGNELLNKVRILLVEIQKVVDTLLRASVGKQGVFHGRDLAKLIRMKSLLRSHHFLLDYFKGFY